MRSLCFLLAFFLALSGCSDDGAGAGGADGAGGAERLDPGSDDGTDGNASAPVIVEVFHGTLSVDAPGGGTSAPFVVPEGPYLELFMTVTGNVTLLGDVTLDAVAPDGARTSLLAGPYVQDDGTGVRLADCRSCSWRVDAAPGVWGLELVVEGSAVLPLKALAQ